MGTIPKFLLRHKIIIEPLLGQYSQGPSYGSPITYACFIDDQTTLQRDRDGAEVVSSATIFIGDLAAEIPLDSRAIVNGRETTVLNVKRRDGGGLPTPDHLEVILR
ncbi:MAG: hypothetical protein LC778_10255 [Acidobacteria bacterium]|nr:hypothetical protein [Acidobacteriota bacterium]